MRKRWAMVTNLFYNFTPLVASIIITNYYRFLATFGRIFCTIMAPICDY